MKSVPTNAYANKDTLEMDGSAQVDIHNCFAWNTPSKNILMTNVFLQKSSHLVGRIYHYATRQTVTVPTQMIIVAVIVMRGKINIFQSR